MAQEPSSRDLLEAVKQQESGGRRYDKSGKLLEGPMTKYGTAKGEMQVLDLTTKDPGYGVKPARDDSPDERARVGRDYLAAMVKRYGDEKTALVAYNWGPGNTDRWLKKGGDFSRLPKETQNYVAKVTGSLGSTKLAQAPATTKVKKAGVQQAVYKAAPLSHPMLSQLGPNFQAAMAVSMLADEAEKEGKSEDEPSEAEKMLTQATVQPVALASVDLGYQSPFPEVAPKSNAPAKQQLQAFKHGGVVRMANGGEVDYFQDPMGAPSAPVTADTLAKGKEFKAADALRMAKEFGTALGSNTESLVRGAVAQVPGAVGDLESLSRKGINFLYGPGGVNVSEKTVAPTSEEIRARVPRITATRPESSGMESMGELMAPGLAKTAAPVAKAAAKGTAKEMLRGMEGQGVLAPISPQESIMYAVKPRGGTFLTSGSMDKPPVSKLDKTLNQYLDSTLDKIPNSDEAAPIIKEFFDKKARRYFTSEFGTVDDPLRRAISSGELQPINKDVDRFPEYLLHAARTKDAPGHDQARRDLEKAYDNASTLEAKIVGIHDPADADARSQFNRLVEASKARTREALALEGVPQELQNIRINPISGQQELGVSYNAPYAAAINDFQNFPAQAGAIQKAEPIYDLDFPGTYMDMFSPRVVAENLSVLPVNKLKNMSFADAMYEGAKRMEMFRNYDKAVEKVEKGAAVPKEILLQFTKPVLKTDNSNEWVKLTDKAATKMEGKMLHHSVGGYANSNSYGHGGREGFDKGIANVFSLRDPKTGYAKATIEAKKLEDGTLMFNQHKGDFNSFPEKNVEDVFKLYDKLGKDKVSFSRYEEMYPNDATGTPLARPIAFNWGKAYEHWKSTGTLPPIPTAAEKLPPPPGQIDIPFAKGGMVERQASTARYI